MKNVILILTIPFFITVLSAQSKGVVSISASQSSQPSATIYAVVIGISDYQDPEIPDLRFADRDAEAFSEFLRSEAGGNLDNDHLKVLINSKATVAQFAMTLDWLLEVARENDIVYIYFSGHGDVEKRTVTQPGYLLCWDAPSRVYLAGGALALPMFQDVITTLSTQNKAKVIIITDACRSGKLSGSSVGGSQITGSNLAKQYANEIKILSCQPDEYSIEGEQWGGGRGAFSYHLLNALYGFADQDADSKVTVFELGRYLEDKVPKEVAPISQLPMVVGNRSANIAVVNQELLSKLKSKNSKELAGLSFIHSRSIQEDILAHADSLTKHNYKEFTDALNDGRLLEPKEHCAEYYYQALIKIKAISRLHSTFRRNFAAGLLDETQQYLNALLKADTRIIECQGFRKFVPRSEHLNRAATLLGNEHYLYHHIMAREKLCRGMDLFYRQDELAIDSALYYFYQSLKLDPGLPVCYYFLERTYLIKDKVDSALYFMNLCAETVPGWIIPFTTLAEALLTYPEYDSVVTIALNKAYLVDSTHPYISQFMAWKMLNQNNLKEALRYLKNYLNNGGKPYACWYGVLGTVYQALTDSTANAEIAFLKAISLDSTRPIFYFNLGVVYMDMVEWQKAELQFLKAIEKDHAADRYAIYLGEVYLNLGKEEESEKYIHKEYDYTQDTFRYAIQLLNWSMIFGRSKMVDSLFQILEQSTSIATTRLIKRGLWSFINSKFDVSQQYFQEVLSTKPKNRVSNVYLSYLSWRNGTLELARKYSSEGLNSERSRKLLNSHFEFEFLRNQPDFVNFMNWLDSIK